MEVIPRVLAENAGLDPLDTLLRVVAKQSNSTSEEAHCIGVDVIGRGPANMKEQGVVEPLRITRQVLAGATEAALSVLRIDDVLWAKQDPTIPDGLDGE